MLASTAIDEAMAHLGAAIVQSVPSDDQIIMGHVREANAILSQVRQRMAQLERLLRPFALVAENDISPDESDHDYFRPMSIKNNRSPLLMVGDFRRARKALADQRSVALADTSRETV